MKSQNSVSKTKSQGLKVKTNVKAGIIAILRSDNHNQTLVREAKKNLRVKSNVKAGLKIAFNHNQTLVREAKKNLRVKTNIKAGLKIKL